jgi:hypothetical protein
LFSGIKQQVIKPQNEQQVINQQVNKQQREQVFKQQTSKANKSSNSEGETLPLIHKGI